MDETKFTIIVRGLLVRTILLARYLLVVPYLILLAFLAVNLYDFLALLLGWADETTLTQHSLQALILLDMTMVANFVWFISAGSYFVFVHPFPNPKEDHILKLPRSLAHLSTGLLKEKMAGSIIGVSSVNLLQMFINASISHDSVDPIKWAVLLAVHLVFIIGLVAINRANAAPHHMAATTEHKNEE